MADIYNLPAPRTMAFWILPMGSREREAALKSILASISNQQSEVSMQKQHDVYASVGSAARAAQREHVLGSDYSKSNEVIARALADAWVSGEHTLVRQTIIQAGTPVQRAAWANGTRKLLDGDHMKDAFDRYMAGY